MTISLTCKISLEISDAYIYIAHQSLTFLVVGPCLPAVKASEVMWNSDDFTNADAYPCAAIYIPTP